MSTQTDNLGSSADEEMFIVSVAGERDINHVEQAEKAKDGADDQCSVLKRL